MSDFVSVLDIIERGDTFQLRAIKDEMAALDLEFRKRMDAGLTPEEMRVAVAVRETAQTALTVLNSLS